MAKYLCDEVGRDRIRRQRNNKTGDDLADGTGRTRDALVFISTYLDSYKKPINEIRKTTEVRPHGYEPVEELQAL